LGFVELGGPVRHPDLFDPRRQFRPVRLRSSGKLVKFARAVPEQSLIGIAIVLALVFLIANRMR
jgi:hypothetical protein